MPLSDTAPLTSTLGLCCPQQRGGHWETRLPCQIMLTAALMHGHTHTNEITHTAYTCRQNVNFPHVFILCCLHFSVFALFIIYISTFHYLHFNLDAYLDSPSLLSSVPGESEREGWGGGRAREKPSARMEPGLESKEEQEAAEAELDLRAGMAGEQRQLTVQTCQHMGGVIHGWFSAPCFYLEEAGNHGKERYRTRTGPAPHIVPDGGLHTQHTYEESWTFRENVKQQTTTYKQISSSLQIWHDWILPVFVLSCKMPYFKHEIMQGSYKHWREEKHFNNKSFDLSRVVCEAKTTPCLCC